MNARLGLVLSLLCDGLRVYIPTSQLQHKLTNHAPVCSHIRDSPEQRITVAASVAVWGRSRHLSRQTWRSSSVAP